MTVALTTTCAYTGADFTSIATMFASIVGSGTTNLANSSTGLTILGATSNTVTLSATEGTKDYTWHTLTCAGQTRLIGSYNTSTQVGTLIAAAGYSGTWSSTPSVGNSYTIDDVSSLTMTLGASVSGAAGNLWNQGGSGPSLGAVGTDASHTITIQGNTPWANGYPLAFNSAGALTDAVAITASGGNAMSVTPNYITIKNLGLQYTSNSNVLNWNGSGALNVVNCFLNPTNSNAAMSFFFGTTCTFTNCCFLPKAVPTGCSREAPPTSAARSSTHPNGSSRAVERQSTARCSAGRSGMITGA